MRQIDLGLEIIFPVSGSCSALGCASPRIRAAAKTFTHQVCFVVFDGTGVRLLLRDAHFQQYVKNFLALDFQLTGQIVDSNLTHPLSFPLLVPLNSCLYARISNLMTSLAFLGSSWASG